MSSTRPLRLLVVAAHPADAFDCAGGTLAKHSRKGDEVQLACVTHGARSHAPNIYGDKQEKLDDAAEKALLDETIREKKSELEAAAAAVGISHTHWLVEEDEPYVLSRETIYSLSEIYRQTRPDILITHHPTERNHHDHPVVGDAAVRAVVTAARWLKGSRRQPILIPTLYFFGTQKYQGVSYNTPEYVNRRIESLEGYWGLMNGPRYAEEFIAAQPHQLGSLPTVQARTELPA